MNFSKYILKIFGWKVVGFFPKEVNKAVVIAAPHTSNWDFIVGLMAYKALGISAKYLMKKEMFFFPLGGLLRSIGAIPVDRRPGNNVVEEIVKDMGNSKEFILTITPEGTRSRVAKWKDGFYRICKQAEVPLFLAKIDFRNKEVGLLEEFVLSNDYDKDLKEIQKKYRSVEAKYPEKFYQSEA